MLFQTERMFVAAHMMLAFPWVIKMGKICCEILDIHLQENQYHTTTIYFSQNQQIIIYFRKFNSFVFRIWASQPAAWLCLLCPFLFAASSSERTGFKLFAIWILLALFLSVYQIQRLKAASSFIFERRSIL